MIPLQKCARQHTTNFVLYNAVHVWLLSFCYVCIVVCFYLLFPQFLLYAENAWKVASASFIANPYWKSRMLSFAVCLSFCVILHYSLVSYDFDVVVNIGAHRNFWKGAKSTPSFPSPSLSLRFFSFPPFSPRPVAPVLLTPLHNAP